MPITPSVRDLLNAKFEEEFDMDIEDILEEAVFDGDNPGICVKCNEIIDNIEPDQREGYCDSCNSNTVKSVMIINGIL